MHTNSTRVCKRCKQELPYNSFDKYFDSRGRNKGYQGSCRDCVAKYRASIRPRHDKCETCGGPVTRGYKQCMNCKYADARAMPEPNPSGLCMCGCGRKTAIAKQNHYAQGYVKGKPKRFVVGHQAPTDHLDPENFSINPGTQCWEWQKYVSPKGYGQAAIRGKNTPAHRIYYEHYVGPIPEGLDIDHLCRNRKCVNPAHLEAVPRVVNLRRGAGTILTPDEVREIRRLWETGSYKRKDIAERFGIASTTVQQVVHRHNWKDIH